MSYYQITLRTIPISPKRHQKIKSHENIQGGKYHKILRMMKQWIRGWRRNKSIKKKQNIIQQTDIILEHEKIIVNKFKSKNLLFRQEQPQQWILTLLI
ncbi:unnamed protein product [Paramecium primaurelia]|uniref:Uncharacterized protein n=1 Tax=Paramecium primaurelia TaxID=5886 RepID=A0A8S1NZE0_PARPR|nr:unnamed protein product [Paramecium primaurelia]